MYRLVFAEKRVLSDWPWLIKKQDKFSNHAPAESGNDTPRRKRDEFGKLLKCVAMAHCVPCQSYWPITLTEAIRIALFGGLKLPKKTTLSNRFNLDCCKSCNPGKVPVVEFIPETDFLGK